MPVEGDDPDAGQLLAAPPACRESCRSRGSCRCRFSSQSSPILCRAGGENTAWTTAILMDRRRPLCQLPHELAHRVTRIDHVVDDPEGLPLDRLRGEDADRFHRVCRRVVPLLVADDDPRAEGSGKPLGQGLLPRRPPSRTASCCAPRRGDAPGLTMRWSQRIRLQQGLGGDVVHRRTGPDR